MIVHSITVCYVCGIKHNNITK